MHIETTQQKYGEHDVARIVVDDTVDLIVENRNNEYTVKLIKNNCYKTVIEEVELEEV